MNCRHQSTNSLFVMCPQPGRQTKKPTQQRKHKKRKRDDEKESSMDPGQISIQKLNEAREMVTITEQRDIILVEPKRALNADLQVVKFA